MTALTICHAFKECTSNMGNFGATSVDSRLYIWTATAIWSKVNKSFGASTVSLSKVYDINQSKSLKAVTLALCGVYFSDFKLP